MKRKLIAILLMCILSVTACSKEPQESTETSEVMETTHQDNTLLTEETEELEKVVEETLDNKQWKKEDFINLMKSYESRFTIMDGTDFDCDILVETQGYMYSYEFPAEENIVVDNCSLRFNYDDVELSANNEGAWLTVELIMGGKKYLIGDLIYEFECVAGESYTIRDAFYNYYYDEIDLNYRKSDYNRANSSVIIKDYDEMNRTVELCYVEEVDYDTSIGYEIIEEKWITMPLSDRVKIVSWSQGRNSSCFIAEENFYNLIDDIRQHDCYFAWVNVENDEIVWIDEVLNP